MATIHRILTPVDLASSSSSSRSVDCRRRRRRSARLNGCRVRRGGGKRLLLRGEGRLVVVGDLRPGGGAGVTAAGRGGEERRGVERCRRRKVAEGRRGGDAGVNTPVISVKCTWAQLARRYYCSYAEPYGLEISGRGDSAFFFFLFFFWKRFAKDEWIRGEEEGCILLYYWKGLFRFGSRGFGKGVGFKLNFWRGMKMFIGDRGYFRKL